MSEWRTEILGSLCASIQTGPFGSQLHQSDYSEIGTPVIMPQDIQSGKITIENIVRIDSKHVERLKRYKLCEGDIVYSRRGDVGRCAYVTAIQEGWMCGTGCLRVRPDANKIEPRFLSYYLKQKHQIEWVERHAVGATMPNLNTAILSAVPISYPSLTYQKKIALILSALDEKIDLNQRLNDNLAA